MTDRSAAVRSRREPPPFRRVAVVRTEARPATRVRVTLGGGELAGLDPGLPAASVRLLLPGADGALEIPVWNGNEFLAADGTRPRIRTLTPLRFDAEAHELDVEIVLHDDAPLTEWVRTAAEGTPGAISGTGRGYEIDAGAGSFVLAGDEAAVPAISTILPALPRGAAVRVVIERRAEAAEVDLPDHPGATVEWHPIPDGGGPGDAMAPAVEALDLGGDVRVWAAGEAAAAQRLRRHCFEVAGLDRSQAVVRGYWRRGRAER